MLYKKLFFLSLLLLTACSNKDHLTALPENTLYFSEWLTFASPYSETGELTLDQVNEKIDNDEAYFEATFNAETEALISIEAYEGKDILWEDYYTTDDESTRFVGRSYLFSGGPYYFAEHSRQTPYEMISFEEALSRQEADLPYYAMMVTEPTVPTYTVTKVAPSGDEWTQTINDDQIDIKWLAETLPESAHSIEVVIPKKGGTLEFPKKTYTNTDYGFSFEFPAYAFPLYDKNGNEAQNPIAEAMTVFERHVSENESHFTIAPESKNLEQAEDPDGLYASQALHVIKLKTGSKEELNQALKENWGYFCNYVANIGTELKFDRVVWDITPGTESSSCIGNKATAWYEPATQTLYLNSGSQGNFFGYNELVLDLAPESLKLLQ